MRKIHLTNRRLIMEKLNRSRDSTLEEVWPAAAKRVKMDERSRFTNSSGITFSVHIVPQQMIKNQCPACKKHTITSNPVCIKDRSHVVCQVCAPKIIRSESTRCPQCDEDNTKATRNFVSTETIHYVRELNKTPVSCDNDTCNYVGDFADIDKHVHAKPSPSPFWLQPLSERTNINIAIQRESSEIGRKKIIEHLYKQFKGKIIEQEYESFGKQLGLNDTDIMCIKASLKRNKVCLTTDRFKKILEECFSRRDTRLLRPLELKDFKQALHSLRYYRLEESLTWPKEI